MPDPHDQATAREQFKIQILRVSLPPSVTQGKHATRPLRIRKSPSPGVGEELQPPPPPSEKLVAESAESTSALTLQELVVPSLQKMLHARSLKEPVIAGQPIVLNNTIDGSSSASSFIRKMLSACDDEFSSAQGLREPGVSSSEFLHTKLLLKSIIASPSMVPHSIGNNSSSTSSFSHEKLMAGAADSSCALTLQEPGVSSLNEFLDSSLEESSITASLQTVTHNTLDGSSSAFPSSCEKLPIDIADSGSAHSLREPELSSLEELLDTTSLQESTTTSPWTVPKNTTDDSLLSPSSLGSKIWIRHCPNWYQVFYIRMDLRGSFWMYPDLGGPFQSLKEAEDTINHYLDELRRRARCRQGELSTVDRLIHEYKYYLDGTPKTDSSKNSVDEKHYLVEALLEQYNEDQKLSGNPTYELEGLMGQQWLYESQDHRWYYHFNFSAKKKEADGHSTSVLFFAEVSDIKTEHACEVNCCCIIEHDDNGRCYGCRTNGSPAMRHPIDSDAYTCGHLDGYLPFGLQSSSSDEEKSEAMLRAMFKDRCDPDYRDKIRRFTPGRGMKRITLSAV